MDKEALIKKIVDLKKEKNAFILAHNYQIPEIQDLADWVDDSLGLARKATEAEADIFVVCGADFMAETAKIFNPEKKVLIPAPAKCPMAGMLTKQKLFDAKKTFPNSETVLYVNSSAEVRAFADCCCTSANAVKVVNAMDSNIILFGPDKNLAAFVKKHTGKQVIPVPADGYCFVHRQYNKMDLFFAKKDHPQALVLVHPEVEPELQEMADAVLSTTQMIKYAQESPAKEFIIGTEVGLLHRLKKLMPGKQFYPLKEKAICHNQKEINLKNLLESLQKERFEVNLPEGILQKSIKPMQRMMSIK